MTGLNFLGIAFLFVWLGMVFYLLSVTGRQKRLEARVEQLRRPVNRDPVE